MLPDRAQYDNDLLWRYCSLAAEKFRCRRSGTKINFKCNICGDGHHKKRGYLMWDKRRDVVYYKCFNEGDCPAAGEGNAWHGSKWLKETDLNLWRQWKREAGSRKMAETLRLKLDSKDAVVPESTAKPVDKPAEKSEIEKEFDSFMPLKKCPDSMKDAVKGFCLSRKLPMKRVKEFRVAVSGKYRGRLVIPIYDKSKKLVYFQCRALFGQIPKYLNSNVPKDELIYGMDLVDVRKPVVVLEGPIDSMFVENSVATMGCSYSEKVQKILDGMDCRYLFDNDRAGNSKSRELLASGHSVFLWSKFLQARRIEHPIKDINDLVVSEQMDGIKFEEIEPYFSSSPFDVAALVK